MGWSMIVPGGIHTNAPSWRKPVFSAVNACRSGGVTRRSQSARWAWVGGLDWTRRVMRMSLRFRGRGGGRRLWLEPAVSFVFELERERPVARLHDPPARQHVHDIGDDVIEQPL